MSSEHVAHLQRMKNEAWRGSPEHAALAAAIAALSAPQPPAEAQPVAWMLVEEDGNVEYSGHDQFSFGRRGGGTPLYAHPPPSAPVGVERKYPDDGNGDEDAYNRGWNECIDALAQQPAYDGGFTAADMMDARQEGREEAQQLAGFSAGDMADAAAQGFRDGVASVGAVGEAMVRKVAKAINAELDGEENFALAWQRLGSNERKLRDRMARAAIAALRDHDQEATND